MEYRMLDLDVVITIVVSVIVLIPVWRLLTNSWKQHEYSEEHWQGIDD